MKKIICIGHASYDITLPVDGYPVENTKNRVDSKVECGGGPASNAAYLLGKWGIDTTFAGVVGNDIYGKRIVEEFLGIEVNVDHIEVDKEHGTTVSMILANFQNGSRTVLTYRDKDMKCKEKILNTVYDYILVDGQELELSIDVIKNNPNAISIIDAGRDSENVIELAKIVNYLVCSKNFAEGFTDLKLDLTNPESIYNIFKKMKETFSNNIIITVEADGCLYIEDGKIKLMPSIEVIPKDSTGAGDIFHGAFVYALMNNYSLEDSIRIGNIAGAISVTRVGGRYSVPTLEEVMDIYE